MASSIRFDLRPDGVAVLTIDQPDSKVNVLTESLWADLETALDSLGVRTDVKGLVIASAKPGAFIAGADLKLLANAPAPNDPTVRAFIEQGLRVLQKLEALPFPTCAAIDGAALGGGLEVALACDCRVLGTNPKVQLGLPEVKLGLIPGWGGTQRLPRLIGLERAARMIATGESLSASEAIHSGLSEPGAVYLIRGACIAVQIADFTDIRGKKREPLPAMERHAFAPMIEPEPVAIREVLLVMIEGASLPLYEAIKLETAAFMRLAGSPESKRLIAEFFASRKK